MAQNVPQLPPPDTEDPTASAPSEPPAAPAVIRSEPEVVEEPPPPEYVYIPAPPEAHVHAPKYSLWVGGRLSAQAYGYGFFRNYDGYTETTGNFIKNGIGTELNVGARLGKRYIPYLAYDRYWSLGTGRRFQGTDAGAYSQYFGIGFRYLFGDPDFIAGFTDLSVGRRSVHVSSNGQSYSMSTLEYFRLGLGAEIRLSSKFTFSPQLTLSSGVMNDTSGAVAYAPSQQTERERGPSFQDGRTIENQASYVLVGIGVGAHFDLFGK